MLKMLIGPNLFATTYAFAARLALTQVRGEHQLRKKP